MCLIVDNDVVQRVFVKEDDPDFRNLHDSLFSSKKNVIKIVLEESSLRNMQAIEMSFASCFNWIGREEQAD